MVECVIRSPKAHSMKPILTLLAFVLSFFAIGQEHKLEWHVSEYIGGEEPVVYLTFEGASYNGSPMPNVSGSYSLPVASKSHLELLFPVYSELTSEELKAFQPGWISSIENSEITQSYDPESATINYRFIPFRINPQSGRVEKLVSFDLVAITEPEETYSFKTNNWAAHSVLANGSWVRMPIAESGLHRVKVSDLSSGGLSIVGEPTSALQLYHNPGGKLPQRISDFRYDDLAQIAIHIEDGGDNVLDANDMVYFYAEGPHSIDYNASNDRLQHDYNEYSERSYVYATVNSQVTGIRVETQPWTGGAVTTTSTGFDELQFHELDERNITGTGREWYGEVFDFNLSRTFNFSFPNRILSEDVTLLARGAASSPVSGTRLEYVENGTTQLVSTFSPIFSSIEFTTAASQVKFSSPNTNIDLTVNYNRGQSTSSSAYLDYISVQARRSWIYSTGGFIARDLQSIATASVVQYTLSDNSAWVWDVTNPIRPFMPARGVNGEWRSHGDSLRTFAVYRPGDAMSPGKMEKIANQDLHGIDDVDMVIISHPEFYDEAVRLADFHVQYDGLTTVVVTPQQVYNEFSCGAQDITAIRDFIRMLYKRNTDPLDYVLLMGDASYDYKDRVPNKQNFVPIYESVNSNSLYSSFMTDDYFVCVGDNDGVNVSVENLDVMIGRMPVKSKAEAEVAVSKIIDYKTAPESFGDWRNRLAFVSDDADEAWETVLTQEPEYVASIVDTTYPAFNIEKIYSDSYTQTSSSGSQSYPEARDALYRSVQRGNLVTSYTGHGGEVGWSSERLLQLADIDNWSNGLKLPLFITITCEFTRLDDPFRTSAGEQLYLKRGGGAIALISTTRVVFVPGAIALNRAVSEQLFEEGQNGYPTLGEVVLNAKNSVTDGDRVRFSLIGDPAIRLNIPIHQVVLDSLNGVDVNTALDTIKARELVTLSGRINRSSGAFYSDFNGELSLTVFDKPVERETKRNDGVGVIVPFSQQENIIYKGLVTVENGLWSTEFIVPRDINFAYGNAKISFYAENDVTDAMGADKNIVVGGLGNAPFVDTEGPRIRLFMNDTNFISGGTTDENPIGLALLTDSSGINVVGNGLGHDIVGVLDGDESNTFKLNAYYEADVDTYISGVVNYPFFNLSNGRHTLMVRVWDVMNNVSEATVNFVVADRDNLVIGELFNYPNPFTDQTTFSFEHNRQGEELDVELHIMDMSGRIVHSQQKTLNPEGNRTLDMTWDATTGSGAKVSSGVYVFRLVVRSKADGSEAQLSERLVYLR
ncbi:MAG: type IX secretion system sortase PorU [Bacteroidetes bacterium]|nr:MAG: type IX secretion system sortase PorU [Bacteroidota bacterium]